MTISAQAELFDTVAAPTAKKSRATIDVEQSGTFTPNMRLPVHRWFRYSAGFSSDWVKQVIGNRAAKVVLDPFVGSGTVCVEADKAGIKSYGVESHPFVYRLARGKLAWASSPEAFEAAIAAVEKLAGESRSCSNHAIPDLLKKCYEVETLVELFKLRDAYLTIANDLPDDIRLLVFLALNAILRPSSHVGTAQWQYVLPNKRKASVSTPSDALTAQATIMAYDMRDMQKGQTKSRAKLLQSDARTLKGIPDARVDLVITSPPYANNYDYADATRLEMTFWGEISSWGDLHGSVRQFLICSSSQHATSDKLQLDALLERPVVAPIRDELTAVCNELAEVRTLKAGKKAYHTMIAAYFGDMAETFNALRRVTSPGANMCLVIGDSAPYGVHAPVERWFGELAIASGFESWSFEKIRDRNIKWKNRKHTVPLHEGRLWIKG
ncbi:DNA methyltransferase [Paraburkholderia xenovorans]|uniref:site-specific DNA-methyltransferase (cytosine-N(4)-specific) n=1 Tax=Paraburkholderia xenovorans (strain LB400) TaxID=266265 RepID=Q13W19_PARXL|nr:DNA methyltransferase [Paraburkholderia xenovorans]ABE31720.1 hypothetical protein Bxe_A1233 [Paraburkholderia xenovorans LB400]